MYSFLDILKERNNKLITNKKFIYFLLNLKLVSNSLIELLAKGIQVVL